MLERSRQYYLKGHVLLRGRASTKALVQDLLPETWAHPFVDVEPIGTANPKLRPMKGLLLLAASKENNRDPSQNSVSTNSKIGRLQAKAHS